MNKVKDKVTGDKGYIKAFSFDLYGCVQALVLVVTEREVTTKWFDVNRLDGVGYIPLPRKEELDLLGKKVKLKGFNGKGVITSIYFTVENNKIKNIEYLVNEFNRYYYPINALKVLKEDPVMQHPFNKKISYDRGPEDKPVDV